MTYWVATIERDGRTFQFTSADGLTFFEGFFPAPPSTWELRVFADEHGPAMRYAHEFLESFGAVFAEHETSD